MRSCLSTTSLNSSSNIMSSKPSLFFTPRQREGEFFLQGCGDKGTTSLSPCAGPSGTNVSLSLFQAEMLNDPEFAKNVEGLELMLRVRDSACSGSVGNVSSGSRVGAGSRCAGDSSTGFLDPGAFSGGENNSVNAVSENRRFNRGVSAFAGESSPESSALVLAAAGKTDPKDSEFILAGAGETDPENAETAFAASGEADQEFLESARLARAPRRSGPSAHATASESAGIIGSLVLSTSLPNSDNSSMGVACVDLASAAVASVAPVCSSPRSCGACAVAAVHARRTVSPMHAAHSQISWSDTGRVQGPTGRRCSKGGVSGPAEDLHPVPEVEAGVNFRPASRVRGQVAGSLPGRQPGTGTRRLREGAVTLSLHPEVPDTRFVSPGRGLDIRQSMGWTEVCGTTQSGIWMLKGNARTCMFPANLDHLRVEWRKHGSYKTALVTPGHDCLCSYKYGHGAAVRPQTNKAIWNGVISLWSRVAPFLSPWCGKKELPTGVNLNHYDGSRPCVRWHSDSESLFGPRDSPKLIVSLSLGNPVELKVRRVSDNVISSITLNHGDVLVMDGSAQSEYLHCTMPGLQGPRVNLTYRWVVQHTASCPLAGVVGCLLPSCVQGLAEPSSRFWEEGENNWSFSWELAFLLFILMSVPLVSILMNTRKEYRNSGQRPSCSSVHFPSRGRARWVGGRRWPLSRRSQFSRKRTFYFPWGSFWGAKLFFSGVWFLFGSYCWVC